MRFEPVILASTLIGASLVCGCGSVAPVIPAAPAIPTLPPVTATAVTAIQGLVHGGVQPVVGAHVHLFAAGSTGYGMASRSLLTAAAVGQADATGGYVLADANGKFSIPVGFACASTDQLYLLASGGDAGKGPNPASSLMAAVGACPATGATVTPPFFYVNEVTTVATAYALSAYAADATHISSSGTPLALVDLVNAFNSPINLVNSATGVALATTPGGNGLVPQTELNTLANLLSACVNSPGAASPGCTVLFSNAQAGTTSSSDTASAAINIAHAPNANVAALFALSVNQPFTPASTVAPSSWILPVTYTGGGLSKPQGLVVDAQGNIWAANFKTPVLSKFNTLGVPAAPAGYTGGGLDGPVSLAVDSQGNIWVANNLSNTLSEFSNAGLPSSSTTGFSGGGLNAPIGIALDKTGTVWVGNNLVNNNDTPVLSRFNSNGIPVTATGYMGGGLGFTNDVQIDGLGSVWVTNDSGVLSKFAPDGTTSTPTGFVAGGPTAEPSGIAFDASNNVWVVNAGTSNNITEFKNSGDPISGAGYSGGGLSINRILAIDGAGNVWSPSGDVNGPPGVISEFSSQGIPANATGYTVGGGVKDSYGIAIDGSGNVWTSGVSSNTVTELVGAAAPVITPLVTAGSTNSFATRP